MEDIFEEALIDIDSDDTNNPLAVVDYVEDLYANYRKMEVSPPFRFWLCYKDLIYIN